MGHGAINKHALLVSRICEEVIMSYCSHFGPSSVEISKGRNNSPTDASETGTQALRFEIWHERYCTGKAFLFGNDLLRRFM
jgi:hypothetical protein